MRVQLYLCHPWLGLDSGGRASADTNTEALQLSLIVNPRTQELPLAHRWIERL